MGSDHPLHQLVSPLGGLVGRVGFLPLTPGEPAYPVCTAFLGDLTGQLPNLRYSLTTRPSSGGMDGSGSALETDVAVIRALAESLERFSTCVFSEEQFLWDTAENLGAEALDLDSVPRCSSRELSHPACPITAPDKRAAIRWVRGVSLRTGQLKWIPAVMVYLHIPFQSPGERFHLPISTGCAAHVTIEQALVNGICEVVERDAIALTWLQQLPLSQIELDQVPKSLEPFLERYRRTDITTLFFNATTDLGIPTVYSVDRAPHNQRLATMVMCATDLDPARAVEKVIRESASCRIALQAPGRRIPQDPGEFVHVMEGAIYMGSSERQAAFQFLTESPARCRLSDLPLLETGNASQNLRLLLGRLETLGLEAYAVELTTDEAVRVGMRVVRVVIPGLQPMTFSTRARYLGHPRLYEAPLAMGYTVRSEPELNPWPQPFA